MIKSLSIEKLFIQHPFYERIPLVKKHGFDHFEFCLWSHLDISRIKELADEHALHVACISGDENYSIIVPEERGRFLDHLGASLETAKELGCQNLYIHSNAIGQNGKMSTRENGLSDCAKTAAATRALMEGAVLAQQYGIVLQVEPVSSHAFPGYYMNTTASAGDVVSVVDSPNVRLLYDIYHMQMMEGDFTRIIDRYKEIIGFIHIADSPGRHEPGTGEINFHYFRKILEEMNYQGIIGFELSPSGEIDECMHVLRNF